MKPTDLIIAPLPDQDVVVVAPAGHRFETPGWRNANHTRHRLPGAVVPNPAHGHPIPPPPPPDPEPEPQPEPEPPTAGRLPALDAAYLASRPRSGPAYAAVRAAADSSRRPDLANQDSAGNTDALARGLLGEADGADIEAAKASLSRVSRTLSLSRELAPLPLVSRLAGRNQDVGFYLDAITRPGLEARGIGDTLRESAMADPTNWGCMARGAFMAAAWYMGNPAHLAEAWSALRRYLEGGSEGFTYKSDQVSWGRWTIAPKGTTSDGVDLDGAIHDIYRGGSFPNVGSAGLNYVWEATQGTVTAAIFADMAGYSMVWDIGDRALLRSVEWMYRFLGEPPSGDDRWIPWVIKRAYGSAFTRPLETPTSAGKIFAWADWLYA